MSETLDKLKSAMNPIPIEKSQISKSSSRKVQMSACHQIVDLRELWSGRLHQISSNDLTFTMTVIFFNIFKEFFPKII